MRISAVNFLNAAPLTWGLRHGRHPEGWEVSFDLPSACAKKLAEGGADAGLVPSICLGRDPQLRLAAPLGVAAARGVLSVLVVLGGELSKVKKVYLDPASRTSQALARIVMGWEGLSGAEWEERAVAPGALSPGEAALIIGDPALRAHLESPEDRVVDLAEVWRRKTGLPFVFAVWAAREGAEREGLEEALTASYSYGMEHVEDITSRFSAELGLPEDLLRAYLTRHLHYALGPEEMESLALFYRLALNEEVSHDRFAIA